MIYPKLLIDGALVDSTTKEPVIDPATGEPFIEVPVAGEAELDRAVEAADRAFPGWAADEALRRATIARAADAIEREAGRLGRLITQEQGRPLAAAIGEVHGAAGILRAYVDFRVEERDLPAPDGRRVRVVRRPLGVVAAIAPWNVPVLLLIRDIAPALLAGNTVVAKPSEITPLATLALGEILAPIFPPGVLNVIAGGKALGAALTRHPKVRKVAFTGSVAGGKAVLAQTADEVKRVSLELGGNDAAIVLADAPIEATADGIFRSAFGNSGQICFAVKRVYAHESIHNDLVAALAARTAAARLGSGLDPEAEFGPLSNRQQFERVKTLLAEAHAAGGTSLGVTESVPAQGYFVPFQIVVGLGDDARLVGEEQFGPALPVLPFRDIDEAIARANASEFGLGGSIWTADAERGADLARRLEVGLAWINQHSAPFPGAPSGGHKWSGLGHRGGESGYDHFVNLQVVDSLIVP